MLIAITGVSGFIGSNLAHWLIDNTEHEVVGFDNLSLGYATNHPVSDRFTFRYCDLVKDVRLFNDLFDYYKPTVCYHFAAYAAEGRSNYIRSFIHQNNTVGTSNIINSCVNYNCKLIFTSSVAVYSGQPPFNEATTPNPIDEYGLSKWTSEKSIQIAGEQQGLDWCIIRPRNVYGERQSLWDTARNVMGIWMNQALNNNPMTIFGQGNNKRTFTYIGDILWPLYNSIFINNEIINLGTAAPSTILQANEVLQHVTGHKSILHLRSRHEVKEAYCDIEKSVSLLGYKDKTDLLNGLKNMWGWAQKQPKRELQISPELEITKNLHSSII